MQPIDRAEGVMRSHLDQLLSGCGIEHAEQRSSSFDSFDRQTGIADFR